MKPMTALLSVTLVIASAAHALAEATPIHVRKTNGCGCCLAWMEHLEDNRFAPTGENMAAVLLVRYKLDNGIPQRMISCHTADVEGYIVEGHVPAADIRRLLEERPDAIGLAVPDMPLGSPGMDQSRRTESYDVFLIRNDGTTEVFASYPGE
ncbi:DUF411 domain-containing protein [Martelella mediterranea]|uniref:DUF411 domain-containing protein n=1 Tax=Martelella mediterranea TaxID=293089 RepID=UPI000C444742|nr:DUF411 domain-containing protein [Martelella mediterranea]MAZ83766.1 hypothetical protein [Hoeflea sp.]MBA67262.1 hypothetical protein [Hyphomicrobiales bacterium]MCD1636740.1 DUF411 domain-containing protein [Martelella mediterranea]|tara:strand:- start:4474 stop:4929 length:456 start_codon:yes stop_codon:yes gene_type:complete